MKKRIMSAAVALIIFIPILIYGGIVFNIACYILTLLALREFLKARENHHKFPDFIRLIAYIMISFVYFSCVLNKNMTFNLDYKVISGAFLTILLPTVLYHKQELYNIEDALYVLGGVFFLGFGMSMFSIYRNLGLDLIIFIFLIPIITDTYAYLVGLLIGKNKLLEEVSPKKTWEGTIGGSIIGCFVCTAYYITVINPNAKIYIVVIISLFLSLVGQFGDLFFSSIKRKYEIKDFSNLIPGHGGILDRLDSVLFVVLAFAFFLGII